MSRSRDWMGLGLWASILLCAVLGGGCMWGAHSYRFTTAGRGQPISTKKSDCPLHVVTYWPYAGYVQIGLVEWDGWGKPPYSIDDFYAAVQSVTCEVGGDVVIADLNAQGQYVRGTVLRRMQAGAP